MNIVFLRKFSMTVSNINIRTLTGSNIKAYLPSLARLRIEIFREYPYLWEKDLQEEKKHLKRYTLSDEAIAVLVFDGSVLVGSSLGIPLVYEPPEIQKPFIEQLLPLSKYFFFGESMLLKSYRRRGLGHHFFDLREEHAKKANRFENLCFFSIVRTKDHPAKPADHLPIEDFWTKRGFAPTQTNMAVSWKDINGDKVTKKQMVLWQKKLPD